MKRALWNPVYQVIVVLLAFSCIDLAFPASGQSTTYYVSMSIGDDDFTGLSTLTPFKTIGRVNQLSLQPGDQVLFKCGDIWRGEMLIITDSGTIASPITFGSYPPACNDKPIISGSEPIRDWVHVTGNRYRADLSAGQNAGHFPNGINQLFRGGKRLLLGRWPNIDANNDGGYSTVDGHASSLRQITDNELPGSNFNGGIIHLKGIRWYILNREIVGTAGTTLTLNEDVSCYTGDCVGWGYFINNHLNTLDQEGEWYYDEDSSRVFLFTSSGIPADDELEGSVILSGDGSTLGGIILGRHLYEHITDVVIDNFRIENWFANGITTPTNLELSDNKRITIRNNEIIDVDDTGLKFATWIWNAGSDSGWRGGANMEIENNVIDGANHYGIDSYSRSSLFQRNIIQNIGLVENLNASGLGCGNTGTNCTENGAGIRVKLDQAAWSASGNTFRYNRISTVGMQGMDVFGPDNTIEYNVIEAACSTKGDCGGIRTFGRDSFAATQAKNIVISHNIILETEGNTDGCHPNFDPLFGFGLYIDNYSDAITIDHNTIQDSTGSGLLIQNSRASITGNTVHNTGIAPESYGQLSINGSPTRVTLSGNVLYGHYSDQLTMHVGQVSNVTTSDNNYFCQPYLTKHIRLATDWQTRSLAQWQSFSGLDAHSHEIWFALASSEPPRSRLFYNDHEDPASIDLGAVVWYDLDQQRVTGHLTLGPFESRVLIRSDEVFVVPTVDPLILIIAVSLLLLLCGSRRNILFPFHRDHR